jgi:hypothetical protein
MTVGSCRNGITNVQVGDGGGDLQRLAVMVNLLVVSWDRNAGQGHSVKIDISSIEWVEEFKYLGMMLTDQNSIQEEIKRTVKLGNACYHSVQIFCLPGCYPKT